MPSYLDTPRSGPKPKTTSTNPHTQLDQNAPVELQERVFELARSLEGVAVGPSLVSVPGTRAFHLPGCRHANRGCFMVEHEFAHLHPAYDGSMHMALPLAIVESVIAQGWAEYHPLSGKYGLPNNIVMVYGPRDEGELEIVKDILLASYRQARTTP